jgi:hypothetical protein
VTPARWALSTRPSSPRTNNRRACRRHHRARVTGSSPTGAGPSPSATRRSSAT